MHEMMAGSGGSPALRQLAQEINPIVRGNLRQLKALQLEMMRQ